MKYRCTRDLVMITKEVAFFAGKTYELMDNAADDRVHGQDELNKLHILSPYWLERHFVKVVDTYDDYDRAMGIL